MLMKNFILITLLLVVLVGACVMTAVLYAQIAKIETGINDLNVKCASNDQKLDYVEKKIEASIIAKDETDDYIETIKEITINLNTKVDSLSETEKSISEISNKILPVLFEHYSKSKETWTYKTLMSYGDMKEAMGGDPDILEVAPGSGTPYARWKFDLSNSKPYKKLCISVSLTRYPKDGEVSYVKTISSYLE